MGNIEHLGTFQLHKNFIQCNGYYYVYFQSFGPQSGLSEILFFTWGVCLRCYRKIAHTFPSPLGLWDQLTPCHHLGKLLTSQRLLDLPPWSNKCVKPERAGKSFLPPSAIPGKEPITTHVLLGSPEPGMSWRVV